MIKCKMKDCCYRKNGLCAKESIKINSKCECDSYQIGKTCCTCYHYNNQSHTGRCWGTKECEICYCDGNIDRCDFYEKGILE